MDTLKFIVAKLNEMLEAEQFDKEQVEFYFALLEEKYNFETQLIDFKFYNEEKLREAQTEKKKGLELQDFEYTANYRAIERECLKCLDYKSEWKIYKSVFLSEPGRKLRKMPTPDYFFYCHFGNAKNDVQIKRLINIKHSSPADFPSAVEF